MCMTVPEAGTRATRLPARCSVNGRFLGQPVTGVQRYAREIVREMRLLIGTEDKSVELVVPPGTAIVAELPPFPVRAAGWGSGHIWEQLALPFGKRGMLVNLCNMAPLVLKRQIVCIHDANVFLLPASFSPVFRTVYRVLLPALGHRASVVATVSHTSATILEQLGIVPKGKVVVLPNGHEHVHRWDSKRSGLFDSGPAQRPFVLLIGSRARHKNAALVLRLAPRLDELGLDVFVAGGTASVFADVEAGAPAQNVRLLGYRERRRSGAPLSERLLPRLPLNFRRFRPAPRRGDGARLPHHSVRHLVHSRDLRGRGALCPPDAPGRLAGAVSAARAVTEPARGVDLARAGPRLNLLLARIRARIPGSHAGMNDG